ncbi:MAG: hypothetical protein LLG20_18265 [Acidobacteriales bacterium]|nr:hypothetical protein [Terriglobales bacterium]
MTLHNYTLPAYAIRLALTIVLFPLIALAHAADWYAEKWDDFADWLDERLPG